ncbi:MAG: T6SS amidase immunity protein Tai4 family protein [Sediminibacterium sp.]|nr:T6SS amidase immunity protein Tai4 family protein [Sediminibacterium sp.]
MKKSFPFLLICLSLITYGCTSSKSWKTEKNSEMLRDYALCRCLTFAMPNDTILAHEISASIFGELSGYSSESQDKIDSLAKRTVNDMLPSPIFDHGSRKPILKNCILFYKSKELDSLIRILK